MYSTKIVKSFSSIPKKSNEEMNDFFRDIHLNITNGDIFVCDRQLLIWSKSGDDFDWGSIANENFVSIDPKTCAKYQYSKAIKSETFKLEKDSGRNHQDFYQTFSVLEKYDRSEDCVDVRFNVDLLYKALKVFHEIGESHITLSISGIKPVKLQSKNLKGFIVQDRISEG